MITAQIASLPAREDGGEVSPALLLRASSDQQAVGVIEGDEEEVEAWRDGLSDQINQVSAQLTRVAPRPHTDDFSVGIEDKLRVWRASKGFPHFIPHVVGYTPYASDKLFFIIRLAA